VLAVACLAGSLPATALSQPRAPVSLLLGVEGAGIVVLVLALAIARPLLVVPAVALVAFPEGAALVLGGPVLLSPILGAGLLLAAELAFWSIDGATPARESPRVGMLRALWLLGMASVGAVVGLGVLAASTVSISGGFELTVLGVGAGVALLALLGWLGRLALAPG
jgi:hypothetical protein